MHGTIKKKNLLLEARLAIEKKKEIREKEKHQICRGKYLDNLAAQYSLRRHLFESDARFRERVWNSITRRMGGYGDNPDSIWNLARRKKKTDICNGDCQEGR